MGYPDETIAGQVSTHLRNEARIKGSPQDAECRDDTGNYGIDATASGIAPYLSVKNGWLRNTTAELELDR